jgi:hypothetical protein
MNKYKVLDWINEQKILAAYKNQVLVIDSNTEKIESQITLPATFKQQFLGSNRLSSRLLRLGIFNGCHQDNKAYISYNSSIFIIDLESESILTELSNFRGDKPLYFSKINHIKGFKSGIYFGEYVMNHERSPIQIYRIENNELVRVFTFEGGAIEHIHNLIPDPLANCVWILTGDFNEAAAIWKAEENFQKVEKIISGKQLYRSCYAYPIKDGLVYATDSQTDDNYLVELKYQNSRWQTTKLAQLNGPCIFGTALKNYHVIATSCEPNTTTNITFKDYFSNTPGEGILSNESTLVAIGVDNNVKEIRRFKKDRFPMILFQFGNIQLPYGNPYNNTLHGFGTALQGLDLETMKTDVDHEI